jgi:glycosyltransferase involved in cell wall biosynthesis
MTKKLISIVTPCYNEELNLYPHFERICNVINQYRDEFDFEHIYTDNCSLDGTWEVLSELALKNSNLRAMRFSNNIGANRAIFMGLKRAKGDAIILIQADLQDPPELIPQFIDHWKEGHDVVYGKIADRHESLFLKSLRRLYYYIVDSLSDVPIPRGAGEFRLTSRRVLKALLMYHEDDLYIRGAIARIGFKQRPVSYVRQARHKGETSNNYLRLISYAINGLISTTIVPIRLVSVLGLFFATLGLILTVVLISLKIFYPELAPRGFTTLATFITFFAGMQLFGIGIIGEYLRKTYSQVLARPLGFIERSLNFEESGSNTLRGATPQHLEIERPAVLEAQKPEMGWRAPFDI